MLVRRWLHELTFKSPRQCVETADREAPRCDLSRKATGAELSMFWGVLRCLSTAHRCIWIGIRNLARAKVRDCGIVLPNVRAKRATTAGRQARAGENVPRTARPGLVACRWRSA